MTPRCSVRAAAREIYGELAQGEAGDLASPNTPVSPLHCASEAAPTPDPSPLLARASGGGEKNDPPSLRSAEPSLTAKARALYEDSAVPVAEIARLCGVTERTIYKYAARENWKPRYRWTADGGRPAAFAPAKGAGGRFIRRADKGKPFATGLKATDPAARGRALAACGRAKRLSRAAQARAKKDARHAALLRALADNARCLAALRVHRQGYVTGRQPSALQLRVEGLLIGNVEWSVRQLEAFVPPGPRLPAAPAAAQPSPSPVNIVDPRFDPDDFRAYRPRKDFRE